MTEPLKNPENHGKVWTDKELSQLLKSIQDKKSISEIAIEHKRTVGGINARRKHLAAEYWFHDKKSIEDIIEITGLTKDQIEDTIKKRAYKMEIKTNSISNEISNTISKPVKKTFVIKKEADDMKQIVELLKDIQSKLNALIEKVS